MNRTSSWPRHPAIAVTVGVFAGALTIMLVEFAAHRLLGSANPAQPDTITTGMYAAVLIAWIVGAGVAGSVATMWNGGRTVLWGAVAGLVLVAGSVATMLAIPHPVWMVAAALTLMPAAAWLSARARLAAASRVA